MDTRQAQQGFTLIEVLVALTLMALVSLISWRGLEALQNTGERLDERAEQTLSLVRVLGQLERDILLHAGPDVLAVLQTNAANQSSDATQVMPQGMVWDPDTGLSLVRAAGDGRWQQLRWSLQDGQLRRAVGAPSHLLPLPAVQTDAVVLDDVQTLTLRAWRPGQGWVDPNAPPGTQASTQSRNAAQGSKGLEISLSRQEAGEAKLYRKVVLLQ